MGRKPLSEEKVDEVERLLREGHSCREISAKTNVSLGKVSEIRKNMKINVEKVPSEIMKRLQIRISDFEERLSKIEHKLEKSSRTERKLNVLVKDLRSMLEVACRIRQTHPEAACIHIGEYRGSKCLFKNPRLFCALCPLYIPKWLPKFIAEKTR